MVMSSVRTGAAASSKSRSSASISTFSSRLCAYAGAPGPKLTATRPRSENCATGVQACFGCTSRRPSSISRSSSGSSRVTAPDGEFETTSSRPAPPASSRRRASASARRAAGRVAEVQRATASPGMTFVATPACSSRHREHLTEEQAVDLDVARREADHRGQPLHRAVDRVHARPGAGGVGALALEDEPRVQVPEAAGVDLVVGRLEHDDERRRRPRGPCRTAPAAATARRRPPRAGRRGSPTSTESAGSSCAIQRASSTITATPPFMSLAPSPCTAPPSIRPGRFPCAGTVSRCPASSSTGLPERPVE